MYKYDFHNVTTHLGALTHIWRQDGVTFIANLDNVEKIIDASLSEIENYINKNVFFRIHRSHIINMHDLVEIKEMGNQLIAVLKNGKEVPVSKRRKKELLRKLDILE